MATAQRTKEEDRQINPSILPGDQHLSFSENAGWDTWSGINRVGGAKLSVTAIGDGVLTGSLESDDKSAQNGSYFGFSLLVEMSRHLHLCFIVWMRTRPFPPPPSLHPERRHRASVPK